eukprot:g4812.t1
MSRRTRSRSGQDSGELVWYRAEEQLFRIGRLLRSAASELWVKPLREARTDSDRPNGDFEVSRSPSASSVASRSWASIAGENEDDQAEGQHRGKDEVVSVLRGDAIVQQDGPAGGLRLDRANLAEALLHRHAAGLCFTQLPELRGADCVNREAFSREMIILNPFRGVGAAKGSSRPSTPASKSQASSSKRSRMGHVYTDAILRAYIAPLSDLCVSPIFGAEGAGAADGQQHEDLAAFLRDVVAYWDFKVHYPGRQVAVDLWAVAACLCYDLRDCFLFPLIHGDNSINAAPAAESDSDSRRAFCIGALERLESVLADYSALIAKASANTDLPDSPRTRSDENDQNEGDDDACQNISTAFVYCFGINRSQSPHVFDQRFVAQQLAVYGLGEDPSLASYYSWSSLRDFFFLYGDRFQGDTLEEKYAAFEGLFPGWVNDGKVYGNEEFVTLLQQLPSIFAPEDGAGPCAAAIAAGDEASGSDMDARFNSRDIGPREHDQRDYPAALDHMMHESVEDLGATRPTSRSRLQHLSVTRTPELPDYAAQLQATPAFSYEDELEFCTASGTTKVSPQKSITMARQAISPRKSSTHGVPLSERIKWNVQGTSPSLVDTGVGGCHGYTYTLPNSNAAAPTVPGSSTRDDVEASGAHGWQRDAPDADEGKAHKPIAAETQQTTRRDKIGKQDLAQYAPSCHVDAVSQKVGCDAKCGAEGRGRHSCASRSGVGACRRSLCGGAAKGG